MRRAGVGGVRAERANQGYPQSAAFTMKADGTVVDVLLKGATPTHSRAFRSLPRP